MIPSLVNTETLSWETAGVNVPVENEVLAWGRHSGEGRDPENPYMSDSTIAQTSPSDPRLRGNVGCIVALGP